MHFFKNDASWSTFRKSLGCLFKLARTYRKKADGSFNYDKMRFTDKDEAKLSKWMSENIIAIYAWCDAKQCEEGEEAFIRELYPPLNIDKNRHSVNGDYVNRLSDLRSE